MIACHLLLVVWIIHHKLYVINVLISSNYQLMGLDVIKELLEDVWPMKDIINVQNVLLILYWLMIKLNVMQLSLIVKSIIQIKHVNHV